MKKILLVDDEASLTRMTKMNLERSGNYTVATENNPLNAVQIARSFHPDLIFLDVMMPQMGGEEVAELLRSDPELASIPVVFMTAIVTKQEIGEGEHEIGGNLFLAKPVKTDELIGTIEKLLGT